MSVTSIEGVRAAPGYAAYAAAKAGVINFTKTAALELAPHGIRVNALAPDITMTEGLAAVAPARCRGEVRVHGAHGQGRARRRDGGRGHIPRRRALELRHRSDHPCRRRDACGRAAGTTIGARATTSSAPRSGPSSLRSVVPSEADVGRHPSVDGDHLARDVAGFV